MPLGIESNSIAPQLIQGSGQALVQGIRQIGQQISGHLTELQTKRDLGALAQEMQGINVQSNEFPVQLTQMLSRHPLAARDERGQRVLSILGKAHGQWQAGEAEARAFNRSMAMQTRRTQDARALAEDKLGMPQNIGGALVIPQDPVTGQPNVLLPAPARAGTGPKTLSPGAILVDPTGKTIASNPKPIAPTPSEARLKKKQNIDQLMRQDSMTQKEIEASIRRRDALSKERIGIEKADDPNAAYLDNTIKAIEGEVEVLTKRRKDIQKAIEGFESASAEEAAGVEAELGVAPPVGAVSQAAPGANVRRVPVLDPNGNPMQLREDQVEAALAAGWTRR